MAAARAPATRGAAHVAEELTRAPAAAVLALQRTAGNRATVRVLQRRSWERTKDGRHIWHDEDPDMEFFAPVKDDQGQIATHWEWSWPFPNQVWRRRKPSPSSSSSSRARGRLAEYRDAPYRPRAHSGHRAQGLHHTEFSQYREFTKTSKGVTIPIADSDVHAHYSRGAPHVTSTDPDWNYAPLGDSYSEYITELRRRRSDDDIARLLLELDDSEIERLGDGEARALGMFTITVYLAEEWRKQGAAKIYRAILRCIIQNRLSFDDFPRAFKFVASAQAGRRQIGRFQDVSLGFMDKRLLDVLEQMIYDEQSELDPDDLSSDDSMDADDKKQLKGRRKFSKRHDPPGRKK